MSAHTDTQVVIVGAGPVGTALAVDLALAGIEVVVLEERAEGQRPHPGTNLTNIRSMEHMRRWGATEHLAAANPLGEDVARDVKFVTRGNGHLLLNLAGALGTTDRLPFSSAAPRWGPQSSIETGLRTRLAELPGAAIRWTATFQRYEAFDDQVVVHYRDADGAPRSISAAYLVGADGSRSAVRAQTGIRLAGSPRLAHFAAWYLRSRELSDLLAERFGRAAFYWFANEDETGVILMAQDSDGLFQFFDGPLPADADGADWDYLKQRLFSATGREVAVEIVEPTDFWVNSLVAPTFQAGRVLLAGESCHHVSVFGGFGMNLGIGDAADLGWKLAGTLKGWAGPDLLASYSTERVPVVRWIRDLTEESTRHVGMSWTVPGMEADTEAGERIRAEVGRRMAEDKEKELISLGAQFGAAYYASPIIVPDGTEPPPATFGEFEPCASPGVRAPHLWLADGRSLYDEVAHEGFTLLRLDPATSIGELAEAAASRRVPLRLVDLDEPQARTSYGAALVLIRPDHYVAWRGNAAPIDPAAVIDRLRGATALSTTDAEVQMTTEPSLLNSDTPVVDYQVHWYPPSVVEQLVGRIAHPIVARTADGGYAMWLDDGVAMPIMNRLTVDLDTHLEHAAAAGVDVLVLGPACLAEVLHLPAEEAAELLDRIHVAYAQAQREHPEHIVGLAALPMQDPSLALKVLDRAIGELDLRGVSLMTTIDAKRPLITEDSLRVFARIAELGVPLVLHPGFRSATRFATRTIREDAGLSWTYQTSLTALRLIDEGVLDAVPDLVVVHPHLGGVLPFVAERIGLLGGSKAKHRIEHYFRTNFYVDTAAGNPGALRLAIEAYGIDRVVFASDYPFYDMAEVRHQIEDAVGPDAAQQIYANSVPGLRLPTLAPQP